MRRRAARVLGPLLATLPARGGGDRHAFPDPSPTYQGAPKGDRRLYPAAIAGSVRVEAR